MATVDEILTRQAYAAGDETWTKDNNYPSYTLYVEPEYVPVTNKRIADFNDQISVRGERNAQFVGFQLSRYDDGIDLTATHLYIHYQTVYGGSDSVPCNVSWSDNHVRMCWQVPAQATQEPDRVQMMIYATGTNSMGERVTWKTLPTSYTIHDGLDIGGGIPEPDTSWYEQFVAQMEGKVLTAQGHANDAQASKTAAAGSAAESAQSAAASAKALEDNRAYVESQKETFVGYNKRETDLKYANALIGTASGMGRVTVGDAWEAPIPDLDISGRSEQFSTTGTQLLVYPYYNTTKTQNGITFTALDDGRVSIKGTVTGNNATYILQQNLILPPGTYTKNNPGTIKYMISRYLNGAFDRVEVSQNDGTFDTDGWDYDVYEYKPLLQTVTVGDTFDNLIVSPMLNAGATAKPWEPYTGGKPSPSPDYPQPMDVTVTGAQLLDLGVVADISAGGATVITVDGDYTISGTGALTASIEKRYRTDMKKLLKPGNLILKSEITIPRLYVSVRNKSTELLSLYGNSTKQITQEMLDDENIYVEVMFFGSKGTVITPGTYYPMLYQDGDGTYQPYHSSTATIPLTEPLRGIGDYRDRVMCRDGVWGIERYISHYKLTSDIVSASSGGVTTTNNIIDNRYTVITCEAWKNIIKKELYENGKKTIGFCTIAPPGMINDWNTSKNGKENVYTINAAGAMYISIPISSLGITDDATRAEVTAAVKQYVTDHDVYVAFVLSTPTWEPLPSATQSALNALTTYTGTTHVTVTAGGPEPDVGLEYVQDTRAVIADLQAQIDAIRNGGTT